MSQICTQNSIYSQYFVLNSQCKASSFPVCNRIRHTFSFHRVSWKKLKYERQTEDIYASPRKVDQFAVVTARLGLNCDWEVGQLSPHGWRARKFLSCEPQDRRLQYYLWNFTTRINSSIFTFAGACGRRCNSPSSPSHLFLEKLFSTLSLIITLKEQKKNTKFSQISFKRKKVELSGVSRRWDQITGN